MNCLDKMKNGEHYSEIFSFTSEQIETFALLTGDNNPIHLDAAYAASTSFGKPIVHGFLGGSIFSKILGTTFPGPGTIYLSQTLEFKRPMFPDTLYEAIVIVKHIEYHKHSCKLETKIVNKETGKLIVSGEATVLNKKKIHDTDQT